MPTYEYECPEGHGFEKFQKMTDKPRAKCPVCGKAAIPENLGRCRPGLPRQRLLHHRLRQRRQRAPESGPLREAGGGEALGVQDRFQRQGAQGQEGRGQGSQGVSDTIRAELERVAAGFGADGLEFVLERPRDAGHGDLATNLAMVLAKRDRVKPREMAERVMEKLQFAPTVVSRTEIAGPGFINFWLAENQLSAVGRDHPRRRAPPTAARPRHRASRSTSSSSPPIPPARCTSATAGAPRWATRSRRCTSGPATMSPASSTSTTRASRSTSWRRACGPGSSRRPGTRATSPTAATTASI